MSSNTLIISKESDLINRIEYSHSKYKNIFPYVVSIAGGSASGKTTTVRNIQKHLNQIGINAKTFETDNYYQDLQFARKIYRAGKINWDNPIMINNTQAVKDIESLSNGKSILYPNYSFIESKKVGEYRFYPPKVLLIDGLYVLNEKYFNHLSHIKIFCECPLISRIKRRINRDKTRCKRSSFETINRAIFEVEPAYYRYVYSSRKNSDIIYRNF